MVISERKINDEVVIEKLFGRFDQTAHQEYKMSMDLALQAGYRHVILDVTGVSFIDSTARGWLVLSQRRFQGIRGRLSLVARHGFIRDILELTEISEWIPIFSTQEDAISATTASLA